MRRRAEQVQEELVSPRTCDPSDSQASVKSFCWEQEAERKRLAALLEGEEEEERAKGLRRERAIADVAWMKRVLEEQLELEREREAEFDNLHR